MSKVMKTIVVAVSRNGIIGSDGGMPWRLSTDLKRFKALTLGQPVIMGRKTFQTIGNRCRADRMSSLRATGFSVEGVRTAHSLDEAIEIAATLGEQDEHRRSASSAAARSIVSRLRLPTGYMSRISKWRSRAIRPFLPSIPALWETKGELDILPAKKDSYPPGLSHTIAAAIDEKQLFSNKSVQLPEVALKAMFRYL